MMLYAVTQDGYTLPTTGFLGRILNPIRSASNSISTSVQDTLDVFTKSKAYQTENEELRQRVAELESQMVDYDKTKQDLADLSEFMGIKEDHPTTSLRPLHHYRLCGKRSVPRVLHRPRQ